MWWSGSTPRIRASSDSAEATERMLGHDDHGGRSRQPPECVQARQSDAGAAPRSMSMSDSSCAIIPPSDHPTMCSRTRPLPTPAA